MAEVKKEVKPTVKTAEVKKEAAKPAVKTEVKKETKAAEVKKETKPAETKVKKNEVKAADAKAEVNAAAKTAEQKADAKPITAQKAGAAPKVYVAPKDGTKNTVSEKPAPSAAAKAAAAEKPAAQNASAGVKPAAKAVPTAAEFTPKSSGAAVQNAAGEKPAKADFAQKSGKNPKAKAGQYIATGRRKKSVARVRVYDNGTGKITINDDDIDDYLDTEVMKLIVRQPLTLTKTEKRYDVIVNVYGGGKSGQAGAIRQGIARALVKENENMKPELKKAGLLTRDSRMKERKKYGLKKARRAPQFSKR